MPNITLAVPRELKQKMDHFKEINWSEVARQAIIEKTQLLEKMNRLLAKSKLEATDIDRYAREIKRQVLKKHRS